MLAALLVSTGLFWGFVAVLYLSPRLRKSTFIAVTYVTLTVWYYYRKIEKKYLPQRRRSISSVRRSEAVPSSSGRVATLDAAEATENTERSSNLSGNGSSDVVRASDLSEAVDERAGSGRLSQASSSSEDSSTSGKKSPRFKLGLLKALQVTRPKSKSVDASSGSSLRNSFLAKLMHEKTPSSISESDLGSESEHRVSSPTSSEAELLVVDASSAVSKARSESLLRSASSSPTRATRRVFVGRKKPANWAD